MAGTDALKSLHTILIDAEKGYQTAIADAEAPDMKSLFQKLEAMHARAHAEVHALLIKAGEKPDESGSFLSLVHKTVISVRSAVAGLDPSSLPSFIDGEERILKAYDDAIEEGGGRDTLRRLRDALAAEVTQMKAKSSTAAGTHSAARGL